MYIIIYIYLLLQTDDMMIRPLEDQNIQRLYPQEYGTQTCNMIIYIYIYIYMFIHVIIIINR